MNMLRSDGQIHKASGNVEMPTEDLSLGAILLHLYPYIALISGCLAWYRKRGRIRRPLNSYLRLQSVASISRTHPSARRARVNSAFEEIVGTSTAVPNPSASGLHNRTQKSNSTIWKAAEEGDVEEIERHVAGGVDINAYSPTLGTPLSVAAHNGNSDVVTWLLSRCAKVNGYYMGYQETTLHSAAERGHETVVPSLLEHGANFHAQVSGVSAIYSACLKGHWTVVQVLVKFGAEERVSLYPMSSTRSVSDMVLNRAFHDIADATKRRQLDELAATCGDWRKSLQTLDTIKTTISEQWQNVESLHPFWREFMGLFCVSNLDEGILGLFFYLRPLKRSGELLEFLELLKQFCISEGWDEQILKEACELQPAISKWQWEVS